MLSFSLFSWKTAIAAGATVATLAGGAVVASAATTEDDFGQQVKQEVATCKASAARTDTHGIGHCVSAWVTTHNPGTSARTEEPKTPEASESPDNDTNEPGDSAPSSKPSPKPSHPTGRSGR